MSDEVRRGRLHLWSGLIILGVYLAGAATAAGVFAWLRPPHDHFGMRHPGAFGPLGFVEDLDLTAAQEEQVRVIIDSHHGEIEAAMKEAFPRIRAAGDRALDEIRTVLTPEQGARFDVRRAEMADRASRGMPPPFGPSGHHPHHDDGPRPR